MVRDRHKEQLEGHISGEWRTAPDPVSSLTAKLGEEYGEFAEDRDPAELYDLLDVIMELRAVLDPLRGYRDAHLRKKERLGSFSSHLEWNPLPGLSWEDLDAGKRIPE